MKKGERVTLKILATIIIFVLAAFAIRYVYNSITVTFKYGKHTEEAERYKDSLNKYDNICRASTDSTEIIFYFKKMKNYQNKLDSLKILLPKERVLHDYHIKLK